MKRIVVAISICSLVAGCSSSQVDESDSLDTSVDELNGVLTARGNLTRRTFSETQEYKRQQETVEYYRGIGIAPDGGTSLGNARGRLSTLAGFISFYGFGASDPTAFYYNRGDLGIGREMHCVDKLLVADNGQIACYVKNFAAGDDGSEFTFGMNSGTAFKNMASGNAFATVAMVYRDKAPAKNKVFFLVYGANGELANVAPLDRHGLTFNNKFLTIGINPDTSIFGTPGVSFNNHIPSNCVACHGGQSYDSTSHSETGSVFLPFDLDQFEYENVSGRTRADQLGAFKKLNESVRKVASLSKSPGGAAIVSQLDGWYNDQVKSGDAFEVFENEFDSSFVPAGWNQNATARDVYRSVVRGSCRSCHISSAIPFNTEMEFRSRAPTIASDICSYQMPHALQAVREFWQSSQPSVLESYYRSVGQVSAADRLRDCGPGNVATLDPHLILASAPSL